MERRAQPRKKEMGIMVEAADINYPPPPKSPVQIHENLSALHECSNQTADEAQWNNIMQMFPAG